MELGAQPESRPPLALSALLGDALREIDRVVGYAEASLMAYDPEVLLPVAFAVSGQRAPAYARDACRNEQLDPDVHKFRDLARARLPVATLRREDPAARRSLRWRTLIEPRGYRHELRAALVDGSGRCWGALSLLRDGTAGFSERQVTTVGRLARPLAGRVARAMVAGAEAHRPGTVCSLWLDDRGEVRFATAGAWEWLAVSDPVIPPVGGRGIAAAVALRVVAAERRGEGGLVSVRLRTSEYTVQDHLKSVFAKAGVRSRGALAHTLALGFG